MDEDKDRIELTVTRAGQTILHTATRGVFAEKDEAIPDETVTLLIWTLWALTDKQMYVRYK